MKNKFRLSRFFICFLLSGCVMLSAARIVAFKKNVPDIKTKSHVPVLKNRKFIEVSEPTPILNPPFEYYEENDRSNDKLLTATIIAGPLSRNSADPHAYFVFCRYLVITKIPLYIILHSWKTFH